MRQFLCLLGLHDFSPLGDQNAPWKKRKCSRCYTEQMLMYDPMCGEEYWKTTFKRKNK